MEDDELVIIGGEISGVSSPKDGKKDIEIKVKITNTLENQLKVARICKEVSIQGLELENQMLLDDRHDKGDDPPEEDPKQTQIGDGDNEE